MRPFAISATPLDIAQLADRLRNESAGGYVSFEGWVRDHNEGRQVRALSYEVFHALAEAEGERIVIEAVQQFGLTAAACVHREGDLSLGDCAVWVGVTAPHRGEAFAACRFIIDAIKHRLPIWKKEIYVDNDSAWVNCQACATAGIAHSPAQQQLPQAPAASDYYARQMQLPEVGAVGQAKLAEAKVLVVGVGGLGSAAALSLAAAGVGSIGLIEHDRLEASNLHRQLIYDAAGIGAKKVTLAADRLQAHNPLIEIAAHDARLGPANVADLLAGYDLVLDCTDNFATKYLLNDAAILLGKTVIQASIYRFEGQLLTIDKDSPGGCLRCLWPAPPPAGAVGDCAEVGVLGTVPALFGTLQANEAIKAILGLPLATVNNALLFDLLTLESRSLYRHRRRECPVCGEAPSITRLTTVTAPLEIALPLGATLADLAARYQLIDLREEGEGLRVPAAYHLPFSRFDIAAMPCAKTMPVLLFCGGGARSLQAAKQLQLAGWLQVYSLQGGAPSLPDWQRAA